MTLLIPLPIAGRAQGAGAAFFFRRLADAFAFIFRRGWLTLLFKISHFIQEYLLWGMENEE